MRTLEVRAKRNNRSQIPYITISISSVLLIPMCLLSCIALASADGIRSKAAVVMDAANGKVLYAKNPDEVLFPASTAKLVTALVVLDNAPDLSHVVTISRNAAKTPPTRVGFKAGDKVTVDALLHAMLIKSANDAAVALAETVSGSEEEFVKLMNNKAAELGATNTRYINANGLPGHSQHITARDLSKIMREAIRRPVLREILATRETEVATQSGKTKYIKNTDELLWSDEDILGGKTGYTRQAMHCFVCAGARHGDTIIVALLGAPSRPLLWKEAENLLGLGSKIMNNEAEPIIYLERADQDAPKIMKTSSRKKIKRKLIKKRRYSRDIRTISDSDRYEDKKRPGHRRI
jgi:D-alanyl-D-alanine carboxypeptidase (penicillin-binding protein 5/6)